MIDKIIKVEKNKGGQRMKKIFFCLIAIFVFLPAFVVATDVDKVDDDNVYKKFEVKADNGIKYSIKYHGTRKSYISVFNIQNDNCYFTMDDVADYCESIDYKKYSVEKIKNGFTILYDKVERIKLIYDLDKKVWTINLHGANSTSKYSVEFSVIKSDSQTLFNNVCRWGARYEDSNNEKIFSDMKVSYNNEQYYVPLTAYVDMVDMRSYKLYPIIDGFVLKIEGGYGESGDSYIAKLTFKKGLLIRKEIKHGVFPDEAWEQTVYSYNEREDI